MPGSEKSYFLRKFPRCNQRQVLEIFDFGKKQGKFLNPEDSCEWYWIDTVGFRARGCRS